MYVFRGKKVWGHQGHWGILGGVGSVGAILGASGVSGMYWGAGRDSTYSST